MSYEGLIQHIADYHFPDEYRNEWREEREGKDMVNLIKTWYRDSNGLEEWHTINHLKYPTNRGEPTYFYCREGHSHPGIKQGSS